MIPHPDYRPSLLAALYAMGVLACGVGVIGGALFWIGRALS